MNYCFLARPGLDIFSPKLYKEIKTTYDFEAKGYFITTNKKESKTVRKILPNAIIFETATYLKEHWHEFDIDKLSEYEIKYDCRPIWKYIYTDRFLINRDHDYVVKITVGLFSFFEKIFVENEIDVYYSETIATLQCYVAYLVGKKTKTKYYGQMLARELDGTHHFVFNDPYQSIWGFDKEYYKKNYSAEEIEKANKFLYNFEVGKIKPAFVDKQKIKPKLGFNFVTCILKFLKGRIDIDLNNPYSYMYYKAYKMELNPIIYYFRYLKCQKFYKKADLKKKYVYFPLHYQPEASTLVCAEKYEKQLYFIDSWAKSLPADTVLYVKEHFALLGNRKLQFYKELKKYPNVILIDPWEDSKILIENCVAVTTLTGTAGFEAMLLRKPVLLGGNVFYENAPGVRKIEDIYLKYEYEIESWQRPSREQTVKYLCEYFRSIHPGVQYGRANSTEDGNIKLLAKSLMSVIKNDSMEKR